MIAKLTKLPLLRGNKRHAPTKPVCPSCGRGRVFEPHSFAVLTFGALLRTSRHTAVPDERLDGFLDLIWHGAHDGGTGEVAEVFATVPLAAAVRGGQGEFYFCSTSCLRRFFELAVDALEARMTRDRRPQRPDGLDALDPRKRARATTKPRPSKRVKPPAAKSGGKNVAPSRRGLRAGR